MLIFDVKSSIALSYLFFLSSAALSILCFFFFNDTATTEIYTLSLHDALPIYQRRQTESRLGQRQERHRGRRVPAAQRSEEHTSELQSRLHLVCRVLLEKKKKKTEKITQPTMQKQQEKERRAQRPPDEVQR